MFGGYMFERLTKIFGSGSGAKTAFDIAALGMIYWNLETSIAHWFFK